MLRRAASAAGLAGVGAYGASQVDCDSEVARWLYGSIIMPALRAVDAETAHRAGVLATSLGLAPRQRAPDAEVGFRPARDCP